MKFSWFGISPATTEKLAEDLIARHGSGALKEALRMSDLAFDAGAIKLSKALWLAARDIAASTNPTVPAIAAMVASASVGAASDADNSECAMTDWLVFFRDPLKRLCGSIARPTEASAFADAARLWRQGRMLVRIENPDGDGVSLARFWAWLAANGDKIYA